MMSSQTDTQEVTPPKVGIPEVANFLNLLGTLMSDPSTTWIDRVLKDNEAMKAAVTQKEIENNGFIQAIAKVSQDLSVEIEKSKLAIAQSDEAKAKASELATEMEQATKTLAEKEQKLQEDASTITSLQGSLESLGKEVSTRDEVIKKQEEQQANHAARIKELEGSLATTQSELDTITAQLSELRSFSCEMADGSKHFVLNEINRIYNFAKGLAERYFREDLSDAVLSNASLFEETRKFVRPIPFPNTNSANAKKVRIAAFLARLGSRLADLIFLPYYMEPDEEEEQQQGLDAITVLLSNLSHSDATREMQLRSMLLAISPKEQKKIAYDRADMIADEISDYLGVLLSEEQQPKFEDDVRKLCKMAVVSWETLRPLKQKVEPFTQTDEDTEKYWLPAELEVDSSNQSKKQANGKTKGLGSKPSLHSLRSANKVILVWPGFSYGSEVLKQGFMLLDSQVKAADEEVQPLKRNQRAMQRATSSSLAQVRRSTARKSKLFPRSGD
ncbi:hypothetical protein F4808DRAFT_261781 [Astrocystis sublimbata]|nr:hypothetical protein F4808DRAFT_261781 [Astrocystis sublimbata]